MKNTEMTIESYKSWVHVERIQFVHMLRRAGIITTEQADAAFDLLSIEYKKERQKWMHCAACKK